MPVFLLDKQIRFPHPSLATPDGLLAIGGDLSPERLLTAYANGIFPWFDDVSEILWWSPDPRMVLIPSEFRRSKSLRQTLRNKAFEIRFDSNFHEVILQCARASRKGEAGTWITQEMVEAYTLLHKMGYAHSVETWIDGRLAGGLYGISLGAAFFGESMFFHERDASKVALSALVDRMMEWDFRFIDAQQQTGHLTSLGAKPVPRGDFLEMLSSALNFPTKTGKW